MKGRLLASALVLFVAGCGGSSKSGPPTGFHWKAPAMVVPAGQEFYQCFVTDQEIGAGRGAVKFSYTAESDVLHHVVVFTSDNAEQSGSSYKCGLFAAGWNFRYAGGKQTNALELPPDVAVPLAAKTKWIVQIHYLNASTQPVTDHSSVDVEYTPPGATFQDAGLAILGKTNFTIPPTGTPYDVTDTCTIPSGSPTVNLFGLWPHMHQIGSHFRVDITQAGTATTPIDEAWNFGDQKLWLYSGANMFTLHGGDTIKTTCTYVNSTGAPVPFGESSTEEMCFNFAYYYPATGSGGC